jgi:hypothetical protein
MHSRSFVLFLATGVKKVSLAELQLPHFQKIVQKSEDAWQSSNLLGKLLYMSCIYYKIFITLYSIPAKNSSPAELHHDRLNCIEF